ncbi:MAG: hypothetical protein H6728_08065 [Myxococcales bacterium]|nr:hypothetical protein [Myxococcales bacterium]MCB9643013.1 hypothetical protein [Myxococcales bacterium]
MTSQQDLVAVPGVCAGHPEHPELLWMFERLPSGVLRFLRLEIDFPEPDSYTQAEFKKFDVDMRNFDGCPYCEARLYFFCKKCRSLSCFSWEQLNSEGLWTCHSCHSVYRMRPKTTPFRVEAQVGAQDQAGHQNISTSTHTQHTGQFAPQQTLNLSPNRTQAWHPKK